MKFKELYNIILEVYTKIPDKIENRRQKLLGELDRIGYANPIKREEILRELEEFGQIRGIDARKKILLELEKGTLLPELQRLLGYKSQSTISYHTKKLGLDFINARSRPIQLTNERIKRNSTMRELYRKGYLFSDISKKMNIQSQKYLLYIIHSLPDYKQLKQERLQSELWKANRQRMSRLAGNTRTEKAKQKEQLYIQEIDRYYQAGFSITDIAKKMNLHRLYIFRILSKYSEYYKKKQENTK
jgi:hypothetical protein